MSPLDPHPVCPKCEVGWWHPVTLIIIVTIFIMGVLLT